MLEYFNSLTGKELNSFKKFIASSYFNGNKSLAKIFDYLKPLHPNIKEEDITKRKLSVAAFGRKKANDTKVRKLISDFNKALDNFIAHEEFERDKLHKKLILAKGVRKRCFIKKHKSLIKGLPALNKRNFSDYFSYYHNVFEIENEIYLHSREFTEKADPEILRKMTNDLDFDFIFLKLNVLIQMETKKWDNMKYKCDTGIEIVGFINNNIENIRADHPVIYTLYLLLLLLRTMDEKYAAELMKAFGTLKAFNYDFFKKFLSVMQTYYLYRIYEMNEWKHHKELFLYYNIFYFIFPKTFSINIKEHVLTAANFLIPFRIAIALKEYEWSDKFIQLYKNNVVKESAKDTYNYSMAALNYNLKKFDTALGHLLKVKTNEQLFYVYSKYLYAQIYYDNDNFTGAKYILNNLRQFIRENELRIPLNKYFVKTFVSGFAKLMRITKKPEAERKLERDSFIEFIETSGKRTTEREWFLERLRKL